MVEGELEKEGEKRLGVQKRGKEERELRPSRNTSEF